MIYIFFKPLDIKKQTLVDVPQFKLNKFKLYELNKERMTTIMEGKKGVRYKNRYEINKIDYTDNSKNYISNMKANFGVYKNDKLLDLIGNVKYVRADGIDFQSEKVHYNKATHIATTNSGYTLYVGENVVVGKTLRYNNELNIIKSTDVIANYKIDEGK